MLHIQTDKQSENFKINKFTRVRVNGKDVWAVDAEFNGKAIQKFYYSNEAHLEAFEIADGKFSGVLN
jgi:hypothetical protein